MYKVVIYVTWKVRNCTLREKDFCTNCEMYGVFCTNRCLKNVVLQNTVRADNRNKYEYKCVVMILYVYIYNFSVEVTTFVFNLLSTFVKLKCSI